MRVVLHIGQQKTGSTSLQHALFVQKDLLLQKGFAYNPDVAQEKNVTLCVSSVQGYSKFKDSMEAELEKSAYISHTYIISNEVFFVQPFDHHPVLNWGYMADVSADAYKEKKLQYLYNLAGSFLGHDVTVVLYLRRQDAYAESLYRQMIRRNIVMDKYAFLDSIKLFLDYNLECNLWATCFGKENLVIRPYENLHCNDIVADFSYTTGIPLELSKNTHKNSSLTYECARLKLLYNRYAERKVDFDQVDVMTDIFNEVAVNSVDRRIFTPYDVQAIIGQYEYSNLCLYESYFQGVPLFSNIIMNVDKCQDIDFYDEKDALRSFIKAFSIAIKRLARK